MQDISLHHAFTCLCFSEILSFSGTRSNLPLYGHRAQIRVNMVSGFPSVSVKCQLSSGFTDFFFEQEGCLYSIKNSSKHVPFFQSGGECLRAYVSVGPDQICHFTDAEGKSGLWYMVQVAGHLLNPVGSEFSATFVGRLVTTLIQVNLVKSN